jgi:tyrosinase
VLQQAANTSAVKCLLDSPDIATFQNRTPAVPKNTNTGLFLGVHVAGHGSVGSQMSDMFISPSDPVFMLHHGNIDRMWTIWQKAHPDQVQAVSGTRTTQNMPPSSYGTLDDTIGWGKLGKQRQLRELVSVGQNGLCYRYE